MSQWKAVRRLGEGQAVGGYALNSAMNLYVVRHEESLVDGSPRRARQLSTLYL